MKKKGIGEDKKGSILDLLQFTFIIFFLVMGILFASWIYGSFKDAFEDNSLVTGGENPEAVNYTIQQGEASINIFDWGVLIVLFMMYLFLAISSFLVDTHPALFGISVFLFLIILVVGVVVSNIFEDFLDGSDVLAEEANNFPITLWIMDKWVWLLILGFVVTAVSLYARSKFGGSELG